MFVLMALPSLSFRCQVAHPVGEFGAGDAQLPTRGLPLLGTSSMWGENLVVRGDKSGVLILLSRRSHDMHPLPQGEELC
jgi:hypothetical protein